MSRITLEIFNSSQKPVTKPHEVENKAAHYFSHEVGQLIIVTESFHGYNYFWKVRPIILPLVQIGLCHSIAT